MCKEVYGYIYMIKNLVNGKIYFGITENDFDTRYSGNIAKYTHNEHLKRSIKKYGIENFEINEQFDVAYTEDELWDLEDLYICLYNTLDSKYGYNKKRSGSKHKGSGKPNEETRKKMSELMKGESNPMYGVSPKERMDEETYKQWLHKQQTMDKYGEANPNYGNTWDDEQRERQSKTWKQKYVEGYVNPFKGHHHTEEWKRKYAYGEANPMFGKTWSEESKMYTKKEGYVNPFKGHHHTEETKQRISEANKGNGSIKIICLNTMQVFDSIREASIEMNINDSALAKHCKGIQKSCGSLNNEPLVWVYYKDYIALDEEEREQFRINKLEQAQPKNKYGQNKRAVICLETKEVYESCRYVRNNLKMDVQKCCSGQRKTCGGCHWMYYEDYLKLQEQN